MIIIKPLYFENYEEFASAVADTLDEIIKENEFNDIAIIAKYEEARQIIKELLCIGFDLHSVDIHDVECDGYDDEFILSVTKNDDDGEYLIWCEPMLRENGYLTDDSNVIYIFDNCSSKVIPYCEGETVYEVSVGEEFECNDCNDECDYYHNYTVNGKKVDKDTFDSYVSKFASDKVIESDDNSDDGDYCISVKCNLDASEAEKIIQDMERRMLHINDMFKEMDNFRRIFRW